MLICRAILNGSPTAAFFFADALIPVDRVDATWLDAEVLDFLPPDGRYAAAAEAAWTELNDDAKRRQSIAADARLATPLERPAKAFFLAGNYAKHVVEQGGVAAERAQTFPYVFMKPPSTTLVPDGAEVALPAAAPQGVDHEVELAVVIGRRASAVPESDALSFVAGYTIVNDLSHRRFRPNPDRTPRERDKFFDWLHGKWFDGFCPCGPCIATPREIPDPQQLRLSLSVDGEMRQDGSTADQVFPVAAVISFISEITTLEPGDLIATGTPAGVGAPHERFLQPGAVVTASIERIGSLTTTIVAPRESA